jgi:membrane-associated protease RseP (regulator of RpoE activity)
VRAAFRATVVLFWLAGCETEPAERARRVVGQAEKKLQQTDFEKLGRQAQRELGRAKHGAAKQLDGAAETIEQAGDKAKDGIERVANEVEEATNYEPIPGARKGVRCRAGKCRISFRLAEKLRAEPSLLAAEVVVVPRLRGRNVDGLRVSRVPPGSLAHLLGLETGDVITKINARDIRSLDDALSIGRNTHYGDPVVVTYERRGKEQKLTVIVDEE